MKNKFLLLLLFVVNSLVYAQMDQYSFKRELIGVKEPWHKLTVPNTIFENVSQNLNDIRVYGVNESNDTIEASYILRVFKEKNVSKEAKIKIINRSKTKNGFYFTFELESNVAINELKLNFNQQNFDWKLMLEGSQNQQQWFTIVDDYRIVSIKNSETDYQFTKLVFPEAKYKYFRVFVKSKSKPTLSSAILTSNNVESGVFNSFKIVNTEINEIKSNRKTEIKIDLASKIPVSSIQINVKDKFDYYRKVNIQYLSDSTKTEKGWKYRYSNLTTGVLNSLELNEFIFKSTIANKIKITINNYDNQPLHVENVVVKGYKHELAIRITEAANYYLTYGNVKATKPNYEIAQFVSNVPKTMVELKLGNEQIIPKKEVVKKEPLFKNKNWLWGIMILIIGVLGWFSLKMMKSKE